MRAIACCHRHWNDSASERERRRELCRKVSRELGLHDTLEVDDFATLQRLCLRESYTHVILPGVMHTPAEVVVWLKQQGIRIYDALRVQQMAASK